MLVVCVYSWPLQCVCMCASKCYVLVRFYWLGAGGEFTLWPCFIHVKENIGAPIAPRSPTHYCRDELPSASSFHLHLH